MKFRFAITAAALSAFFLVGCIDISPKLDPGITPPPLGTEALAADASSAEPTANPTAEPTPDASVSPDEFKDVLGNVIYSDNHFERYISFRDVLVYEENGDTFVDLTVDNSYPKMIMCAVNIAFYNDDGSIIASSSLQMPDGSFMLSIPSGKSSLFARVLTDTLLTNKTFRLIFDQQTGIKPQ